MAYRIDLGITQQQSQALGQLRSQLPEVYGPILRDAADILKEHAVQNLSGVPFTSKTGTHTIQKRTGKLAASVQSQWPYGSPFRARVFASALTKYADNPETHDYAAILEYGRGEIRPKYTPSAKRGNFARARLTIPGGPHGLVSGANGFRGITGRYSFVRSIPPMEGKFWMEAAAESAGPEIKETSLSHIESFLSNNK